MRAPTIEQEAVTPWNLERVFIDNILKVYEESIWGLNLVKFEKRVWCS